MADTCGTLAKAAQTLRLHGANRIYAIVVHGILSGNAIDVISWRRLWLRIRCRWRRRRGGVRRLTRLILGRLWRRRLDGLVMGSPHLIRG
jgi:hypothetical protein